MVCIDVAFHVASYFSCRQFNRMQKAFAIPRACLHFANLREIGLGVFLALLVLGIQFWFNTGRACDVSISSQHDSGVLNRLFDFKFARANLNSDILEGIILHLTLL